MNWLGSDGSLANATLIQEIIYVIFLENELWLCSEEWAVWLGSSLPSPKVANFGSR
jgi:hypothetical protein